MVEARAQVKFAVETARFDWLFVRLFGTEIMLHTKSDRFRLDVMFLNELAVTTNLKQPACKP